MGDLYSVDYDQQSIDLLPPNKRKPVHIAIVQGCMRGVQWARNLVIGTYKSGSNAPIYSAGVYNKYDQVIFKKSVYMSLVESNSTNPTDASWLLIQNDFIGIDERINFNSQKVVLEYALNKRFGGTFRLPPAPSPADIFIGNIAPVAFGFRVGQTTGSSVGQTMSSDNIGSAKPFRAVNGFQINFPIGLYALTSEKEVRDYTDQYSAFGINYIIITY